MVSKDGVRTDAPHIDSGAACLSLVSQIHQIAIDAAQISHQYGIPGATLGDQELLRAAKAVGYKSRLLTLTTDELAQASLPAIAKTHLGEYFVVAKAATVEEGEGQKHKFLIQVPSEASPQSINAEELGQMWTGELILLTRRGSVFDAVSDFDIRWFIPSLVKYRKLFGEVILASFFLQLFALVTPLFFQVVMDKVLVHRGLTTLDVIVFAFFVVAIFDGLLGGIRNYIFSHTANRVDVELGAKLFNHLVGHP